MKLPSGLRAFALLLLSLTSLAATAAAWPSAIDASPPAVTEPYFDAGGRTPAPSEGGRAANDAKPRSFARRIRIEERPHPVDDASATAIAFAFPGPARATLAGEHALASERVPAARRSLRPFPGLAPPR